MRDPVVPAVVECCAHDTHSNGLQLASDRRSDARPGSGVPLGEHDPPPPGVCPEYHKDGAVGGYLRRFSCRVCIFSTDTDLRTIHQHDREAFGIVSSLEA